MTAETEILGNVHFNGPRAGINFNDGCLAAQERVAIVLSGVHLALGEFSMRRAVTQRLHSTLDVHTVVGSNRGCDRN